MIDNPRDLRSVLEEIADEDGRAATPTPTRAQAELASLTLRIRRRRAFEGVIATTAALAAAGVIGVVAVFGVGLTPQLESEAGPRPVAPAAPSPSSPSPSATSPTPTSPTPAPTPVPGSEEPAPLEPSVPAAPPIAETPAPRADDPETMARTAFAEYLDAWRRGDSETLRRLSQTTNHSWAVPLDYVPVTPEMSCEFSNDYPYPMLECDVDLVGAYHYIMRVTIEPTADGQWLARAAQMGLG